jgi:hypothetical protein
MSPAEMHERDVLAPLVHEPGFGVFDTAKRTTPRVFSAAPPIIAVLLED